VLLVISLNIFSNELKNGFQKIGAAGIAWFLDRRNK